MPSAEQRPLSFPLLEVFAVGLPRALQLGDLGDRHVPPAFAVGRVDEGIAGDVNERGGAARLRRGDRGAQLVERLRAWFDLSYLDAIAAGVGGEVDREV